MIKEILERAARRIRGRARPEPQQQRPEPPRPSPLEEVVVRRQRIVEQVGRNVDRRRIVEAILEGRGISRGQRGLEPVRMPPRRPPEQRRVDWRRLRDLVNMPPAPAPRPEPSPPTDTRRPPTARTAPRQAASAARSFPWALAVPSAFLLLSSLNDPVGRRLAPLVSNQLGRLSTVPGSRPAPEPPPVKDPLSPPNPSSTPFAPGYGSPLGLSAGLCEQLGRQKRQKKRRKCQTRFNVAWTSGPNKGKVAGSRCFKFK